MANLAVLTTFAGEGDVVVSDKLNHASLLDAARFCGARHRTFPHGRYPRARDLLAREPESAGRRFLVTDAVFSMDGDVANLAAACDAAEAARALVIIDDAHGTGVLGARGAGVAELQGVEERVAVCVGTLSKALGSLGGFVTGPRAAIETLVNGARSFIYTTALPAGCAAAALAALRIIEREPARRERVMALARRVRGELGAMGYDCGNSTTPIVPVILGDAEKALRAAAFLRERGLHVPAIRPPTVAPGAARLRISLMATHGDGQVARLLTEMGALARERGMVGESDG
jgi:7-keto-8-aminopelargonate synthetase-like enzyme